MEGSNPLFFYMCVFKNVYVTNCKWNPFSKTYDMSGYTNQCAIVKELWSGCTTIETSGYERIIDTSKKQKGSCKAERFAYV